MAKPHFSQVALSVFIAAFVAAGVMNPVFGGLRALPRKP
jgi:hypothetical protein